MRSLENIRYSITQFYIWYGAIHNLFFESLRFKFYAVHIANAEDYKRSVRGTIRSRQG